MDNASFLLLQDEAVHSRLGSPYTHQLFDQALRRGRFSTLLSLLGLARPLSGLSQALRARPRAQSRPGLCSVDLRDIRGSESRPRDFDRNFNPRSERMRFRWVRIAACLLDGEALPPVQLIEVDGEYYVRDGHHRVSAARALGMRYIEAEIV